MAPAGLVARAWGRADKRTIPIRESEVGAPAEMMVIGEDFTGSKDFMRIPSAEPAKLGNAFARHDGNANVLFGDRQVDSPRVQDGFGERPEGKCPGVDLDSAGCGWRLR